MTPCSAPRCSGEEVPIKISFTSNVVTVSGGENNGLSEGEMITFAARLAC